MPSSGLPLYARCQAGPTMSASCGSSSTPPIDAPESAARLARHALTDAVRAGRRKVVVELATDQEHALAMFGSLGFTGEALLRDHIRDRDGNLRDLIMLAHFVDATLASMNTIGVSAELRRGRRRAMTNSARWGARCARPSAVPQRTGPRGLRLHTCSWRIRCHLGGAFALSSARRRPPRSRTAQVARSRHLHRRTADDPQTARIPDARVAARVQRRAHRQSGARHSGAAGLSEQSSSETGHAHRLEPWRHLCTPTRTPFTRGGSTGHHAGQPDPACPA